MQKPIYYMPIAELDCTRDEAYVKVRNGYFDDDLKGLEQILDIAYNFDFNDPNIKEYEKYEKMYIQNTLLRASEPADVPKTLDEIYTVKFDLIQYAVEYSKSNKPFEFGTATEYQEDDNDYLMSIQMHNAKSVDLIFSRTDNEEGTEQTGQCWYETLEEFINKPCYEIEKDLNEILFYAQPVSLYPEEEMQ